MVEILSPSTARFDRTEKFADYRTIPSLMDYVLVDTEPQAVEHFQKDDHGNWNQNDPTEPIQLASINDTIALSDIYEDTDIPRR